MASLLGTVIVRIFSLNIAIFKNIQSGKTYFCTFVILQFFSMFIDKQHKFMTSETPTGGCVIRRLILKNGYKSHSLRATLAIFLWSLVKQFCQPPIALFCYCSNYFAALRPQKT